MTATDGIRAGPVGRVLRLVCGAALVFAVGPRLLGSGAELWLATTAVIAAEFLFYAGLHLIINRYFTHVDPWIGAVLALAPVVVVYVSGGAPGRLGSVLFVGISLLFTAWNGDGGCEVMTLPGMVLGKRTHLVCIAFSPVDWLEARSADRGS